MQLEHCSYHYQSPATSRCFHCDRLFGDCCLSRSDANQPYLRCPLCTNEIENLGSANTLPPFWYVMHKFLVYPAKPTPLGLAFFLSALSLLITAGLVGLGIGLFIMVVSTRYFYAILDESSNGRTTPPSALALFSSDPDNLFIKQIVIFIIIGLVIALVSKFGNAFFIFLVWAFITLAFPASIMILATDKRLAKAINPLILIDLMTRMGAGYFVLYGFINILLGGPAVVGELIIGFVPQSYHITALIFISLYFWFATAYLMGYALMQYQRELGSIAVTEEGELEYDESSRDKINTNLASMYVIEGRYDDAYALLKKAATAEPENKALQKKFNQLLICLSRREELEEHSSRLIDSLVNTNAIAAAAQTYLDTLSVKPDFKYDAPENILQFADYYCDCGQYTSALKILAQISKYFKDWPDIGKALLKAAHIYADNLNQPEKAIPLLTFIDKSPAVADDVKAEASQLAEIISS